MFKTGAKSYETVLAWARGDDLAHDIILHPDTVRDCLKELSKVCGNLAFTPEIQHRCAEVLQTKFDTDIGNDIFVPPNYAPYDDPKLAAFYGIDTSQTDNLQTRKESTEEQRKRLVREVVREVEVELPGLAQMMNHFSNEEWARHGVANEAPYMHSNPDVTLLRNPGGGWNGLDNPISTSDKGNVINMYEGQPEYTFPRQHPGWETDKRNGYFSRLN